MKILQIRLKNITSLRAEEAIQISLDKAPFADAGIFAITGPTGAGKTSILDAITLALYRQVPRLNKIKDGGKLSDIVSYGASDALAELTFENNGKVYRSTWHIRTKGKNGQILNNPVEKVQLLELNADGNITLASDITEHRNKIEEILKLDYQQFLRSVLLAQGEFSAFLDAKTKDRGELLEQITGKNIYKKIGEVVQEQINTADDQLKQIQFQSDAIAILEEEEKEQLESEVEHIKSQLKGSTQTIASYQKNVNWFQKQRELQEEQKQLEGQKASIEQQAEELKDINLKLEKHQRSQSFRELIAQREEFKSRLTKLAAETENKEKQTQEYNEAIQQISLEVESLNEEIKKAKASSEQWKKDSQKASEIQGTLSTYEKQLKEQSIDLKADLQSLKDVKSSINNEEEHISVLNKHIGELEDYLEQNKSFKEINEQLPGLSDLFSKEAQIKNQLTETKQLLDKRQMQVNDLNEEYTVNNKSLNELQQSLNQLLKAAETLEQQLGNRSLEQTLEENHALERKIEHQLKAQDLLQRHQKGQEYLSALIAEINAEEDIIKDQSNNIHTLEEAYAVSKSACEKQKTIIESLQLLNHEVILEARAQLKEGEACPVCGSKHHELHSLDKDSSLSKEKDLLQNLRQQEEKLRQSLEKQKNQQIKQLTQTEAKKEKLEQYQNRLKEIEENFNELPLDISLSEEGELQKSLEQNQQLRLDKNRELETLKELFNQRDLINKKIQKAELDRNQSNNKVLSLQTKIAALKDQIKEEKNRIDPLYSQEQELKTSIQSALKTIGISLNPNEPNQEFLKRLQESAKQYQEKLLSLTEQREKAKSKLSRLDDLKIEETKLGQSSKEKEDKLNLLGESLENKKEDLQELIQPYSSVEEKNTQLDRALKELETKEKETESRSNLIKTKADQLRGALSTLRNEMEATELKTKINNEKLKEALASSTFHNLDEVIQSMLSQDQYNKLENKRNTLHESAESWKNRSDNLRLKSAQHDTQKNFDSSEEQLRQKLEELQKEKDEQHQRLGQIDTILQNDKLATKENEQVLKKIQNQKDQLNEWKRLKTVLGGNIYSFSQYAQSLTLAHLIKLANVHLCKLNSRYTLKMKSSDKGKIELNFVLDDVHYPGIEKKLSTASGGEKFLISLALALGLSDLSSQNVQIGSLFIDEGFGTLDENTLSTAIAALETLRAQGKTIGVISHVKALKEKISTQVQVYKKNNGNSGLSVNIF